MAQIYANGKCFILNEALIAALEKSSDVKVTETLFSFKIKFVAGEHRSKILNKMEYRFADEMDPEVVDFIKTNTTIDLVEGSFKFPEKINITLIGGGGITGQAGPPLILREKSGTSGLCKVRYIVWNQ
jgi:uncharacterized protein YlzI (FlbEa/FlbD family)